MTDEKKDSIGANAAAAVDGPDDTLKEGISHEMGINSAEIFLRTHEADWGQYTSQEARKVLWKIDRRLIPLMMITTILAAVDKIIISNAALYGMTEDTNMKGQAYSWVGSIFYFGYLINTYPASLLMQKFPVGKCLAVACFGWGAIVMLIAPAKNGATILALRFFMGAFEAFLFPGVTLLTAMWYTRDEQPLRAALMFSALSSLIAGIISYGVGHTTTAIAPWRLLFLIMGSVTVFWGVVLFFFLPDSPLKENFLKGKDKYIALSRIKSNMTGVEDRKFKWYQVREALTDYKTYALFFFFLCMNVPTGGLVTFAAQIVNGLGYSRLQTTLIGMPTGVVQTFAGLLVAIPQRWLTNMRCFSAALCCLVPLTCSLLMRYLSHEDQRGRLLAYYFFYFFWGPYGTGKSAIIRVFVDQVLTTQSVLSLSMANVAGHTKKLTVNALIFIAYCTASIIGPQVFLAREAPDYATGYNSIMGFEIAAIVCLAVYGVGCYCENRQRDRVERENLDVTLEDQLDDRTDKEKPGFRYVF